MTDLIRKNKRATGVFLVMILLVTTLLFYSNYGIGTYAEKAEKNERESQSENSVLDKTGTKDEVIYANLGHDGSLNNIYVVNVLNIGESGSIKDYGEYSEVSNLTDTTEIINSNGEITINSEPGKFYYEGTGDNFDIPWNIDIDYYLDGSRIATDQLAGASGELEMRIKTTANQAADSIFYDNYMLQISVPMDMRYCENIRSDGGTDALSGNKMMINFTVLPGSDGDYSVRADVKDFEMESIQVSGIPFSMDFSLDELTSEFDELIDAVSELDSGMSSLNKGVGELSSGLKEAGKGSSLLYKNMKKLDSGTKDLSKGSEKINSSLKTMAQSLGSSSGSGDMSTLITGLETMSTQLKEMSEGMTKMMGTLDTLAPADTDVPASALQELMTNPVIATSQAAMASLMEIADYVNDAATFIGAYNAMSTTLGGISSGMSTLSTHISDAAEGLKPLKDIGKLQTGISQLSASYVEFDKGLQKYLSGVSALTKNYGKFNKGMGKSASGGKKLATGSQELTDGMNLFSSSVSDIPDQMESKVNEIVGSNDFEPVSFVSDKNKNVNLVQFVLTTDKIKKPKDVKVESDEDQGKESVWQKIIDLFN